MNSDAALLLSPEATARVLGVSRTSLYALEGAGKLPRPALRQGRLVRWSSEDLRRWVAAGCPDRAAFEKLTEGGA